MHGIDGTMNGLHTLKNVLNVDSHWNLEQMQYKE